MIRKAARAIIIENGKILVMYRNKQGSEYYTLVGGRVNNGETMEQALVREVKEETGLDVVRHQLAFIEEHPEPYNEQYIFLCEVAPHGEVAIQEYSEEGFLNKLEFNTHRPMWVATSTFSFLHFLTPQLHQAILDAFKRGFPRQPVKL